MATRDPYEVLGVERDADADTIKSAYRQRAMQYHPDRNPGDATAEERFKELSEAYALLRDPEARRSYDTYGRSDPRGYQQPNMSTADWQTIFQEVNINVDWGGRGAAPATGSAVFDMLFGMVAGMLRNSGLLPGETREVRLDLRLGEAALGSVKRVRVPGPSVCAVCGGTGRVTAGASTAGASTAGASTAQSVARSATVDGLVTACGACGGRGIRRGGAFVDVTVPVGSSSNTKLRLRSLGGPGNPPGDLLVDLEVALPTTATVMGNDVHDTVVITPMALGSSFVYEGVNVSVPSTLRKGQSLRVRGAGIDGGDLVLRVEIDLVRGIVRRVGGWLNDLVGGGAA
ncbi:MAG TPA: DnaJ domain-containing protein [Trueperaceae bacterium]|nr:DnaJ domain-containing protein [Trueperaceae bacterium]